MRLVLCSEGFHTPNTVQACVDLVGKPQDQIRVAVINEAYAVEDGDKYWVLDNLRSVADNFTGGMDIVNLLALPLAKVEEVIRVFDLLKSRHATSFWDFAAVSEDGPIRLYKATPQQAWMNDGEQKNGHYIDTRTDIRL